MIKGRSSLICGVPCALENTSSYNEDYCKQDFKAAEAANGAKVPGQGRQKKTGTMDHGHEKVRESHYARTHHGAFPKGEWTQVKSLGEPQGELAAKGTSDSFAWACKTHPDDPMRSTYHQNFAYTG